MADIHSATAEIRKKRKIEEETTGQKYNVCICQYSAVVLRAVCEKIYISRLDLNPHTD